MQHTNNVRIGDVYVNRHSGSVYKVLEIEVDSYFDTIVSFQEKVCGKAGYVYQNGHILHKRLEVFKEHFVHEDDVGDKIYNMIFIRSKQKRRSQQWQYRLHQYLTDKGLWEDEADKVLDIIKSDDNYKALSDVFNKEMDYPKSFLAVAMLICSSVALDWIDKNKPMHFAQYMFEPNRIDKQ